MVLVGVTVVCAEMFFNRFLESNSFLNGFRCGFMAAKYNRLKKSIRYKYGIGLPYLRKNPFFNKIVITRAAYFANGML